MKKKREPYRDDQAAALDAIDARRIALGLTIEDLCAAADISVVTWWRMRRTGLGFVRRVRALKFALRTAEEKSRNAEAYFPDNHRPGGDA